jgi:SAM-dependent methyltransferase
MANSPGKIWLIILNIVNLIFGKYLRFALSSISRHLARHINKGKLLDIGCGTGDFLQYVENTYESCGIDIDIQFISESRKFKTKSNIVIASATNLPFKPGYFDVVTSWEVMEHILDPSIAIGQISTIIKDNGIFFMSTPNLNSKGRILKNENWYGYQDPTHISLAYPSTWISLLTQGQFEIVESFSSGFFDTPYFRYIPSLLQHLFIKIPFILLFYLGLKLPLIGEGLFIVSTKKPTHRLSF